MKNVVFEKIEKELWSVFQNVQSADKLLEIAPIYCIHGMGDSGENVNEQCEKILLGLQSEKIFLEKNSCYIVVSCDVEVQNKNIDYAVAFRDGNGTFYSSLHKLIEKTIIKQYAKYGIISLHITECGYFERDTIALQQLLQQIQLYQNHFLFFILLDGEKKEYLQSRLHQAFFCQGYEYEKPSVEQYINFLIEQLKEYGITCEAQLECCLRECVEKHYKVVNASRMKQFIRQLVWNCSKNNSSLDSAMVNSDGLKALFDVYFEKYQTESRHQIGFMNN